MLPNHFFTGSDSLAVKRKKQIDTLKVFNANVSEITEDSEYKVEFVSGTNQLALLVLLKPEFPMEKPVLKIVPPVKHHWVEEGGEITGAPGLLNFTVHSDLGRVVQAIVRELELRPPQLVSDETSPPRSQRVDVAAPMSPNNYTFSSTPPGPTSSMMGFRDYRTAIPGQLQPMSVTFPELNTLSNSDLQLLNSCVDRLDEFVDSLPVMREINKTLEEWMTSNEELAKENLSKEPRLQELKRVYQERADIVAQLRSRHETLSIEYQRLADRYSPQSIREHVKQAVIKSDEESEHIAERFLSGELDLDNFLSEYTQKRMLSHCRKTKEDKLSHQLRELKRAGF